MVALAAFASIAATNAQDNVETTVAADVVNQYIWRGQESGNVSLQPTLGVAYKGFSLTAAVQSHPPNLNGALTSTYEE